MNALEFARRKVIFHESSPITGRFEIRKYRMLEKPLLSLSDIRIKRTTTYKASSALGTIFLQIALAFRLDQCPGNSYFIGSSKEDSETWSKTRGKKWLTGIPSLQETLSNDKHAVTNSLFQWPHQWLEIQGPGENAQQGRQCTYLFTDESHVEEYKEGALASFEERMSKRWNRHALHNTTAADEGKEVDRFYYMGGQNEFHVRCPKCNELTWPLWEEDAKLRYNGERIFHFTPNSERVIFVCPHCDKSYEDSPRERFALHEDADYVTMNPSHLIENESYRWNCFAAHWVPWSEQLNKYREALDAAKLGNLQPYENFQKKRLTNSYRPTLPDFGDSHGENNYTLGQSWDIPDFTDILTADLQAGKKDEGGHLWALVTRWDREGNSRRIAYRKLPTWTSLRAMQLELKVEDKNVYVDSGYDNRTVFWECSQYHWYATRGDAAEQLYHKVTMDRGKPTQHIVSVPMPYSQAERQNGNVGSSTPLKLQSNLRGTLPLGWCLCVVISNPQIYGYLHALQSGVTGRYFGVASDMPTEYTDGFPAFIPIVEKNKKTNVESIIWRKVKRFEHPHDCECMALVGAMRAGYYPLKNAIQTTVNKVDSMNVHSQSIESSFVSDLEKHDGTLLQSQETQS